MFEVLESALEENGRDVGGLTRDELVAGYAALHRASEALEAERLRWLGEIERRRLPREEGYLSTKAWLADRFRVGVGQASDQVKVASALAEMPQVAEAFSAGEVSSSAVRVLARARQEDPEAFAAQESALVEAARTRSVEELRRIGQVWSQAVASEGAAERQERLRERRHLEICPTTEGMVRVSGELDQESGEVLASAVAAICDAEVRSGRGGMRTAAQLRADAITELAERFLADQSRPASGGERPHVELTMSLDVYRALEEDHRGGRPLSGHQDGARAGQPGPLTPAAWLDHTGPVPLATAERLACDCGLRRIVLDAEGMPLDVGRKSQTVPPPLRRAVIARDRRCTAPGCDRPPGWCQVHHVRHWIKGGPTRLDNLALVCAAHHRMVHSGVLGIRMVDGRPEFFRVDGSAIEPPAAQSA